MVNKVILLGNLGTDPKITQTNSGETVAQFSLATSSKRKGQNGEMIDETRWHRIVMFGQLAKITQQYLRKGSKVFLEGKLKTTKYQKDGQDHYVTQIYVNQMQMLGSKNDQQAQPSQQQSYPQQSYQQSSGYQQPKQQSYQQQTYGTMQDDSVPF